MPNTTFQVGDLVNVLSAIALPKREVIVCTGRIHKITFHSTYGFMNGAAIYWVEGRKCGLSDTVLRKAVR